jgi:hypothetical protein
MSRILPDEFRFQRRSSGICELVVDPPLIVHLRIDPLIAFLDQPGRNHPSMTPYSVPWADLLLALRVRVHLVPDAVPVPLPVESSSRMCSNANRVDAIFHDRITWLPD